MQQLIRAYRREERERQVIQTLAIKAQHNDAPEATCYQIAKSLGMSRSSHLDAILKGMVSLGLLSVREVQHRPNKIKSIYSLPEGSYELPQQSFFEMIKINGREYLRHG